MYDATPVPANMAAATFEVGLARRVEKLAIVNRTGIKPLQMYNSLGKVMMTLNDKKNYITLKRGCR